MRVIDPGHVYEVASLDGGGPQTVTYVKREGPGYPGNVGHHPGTILQEMWRSEIHRLKYLDGQESCQENYDCINWLRHCILRLEQRAARRHGRELPALRGWIEDQPICPKCGHIECWETCK
jgi:hypothetical protein